jgi:hypothetical protein
MAPDEQRGSGNSERAKNNGPPGSVVEVPPLVANTCPLRAAGAASSILLC